MYNDRAEKYEHIFRNCVGYADPDVTAKAAGDLKLSRDCKIVEFGTGTGLVGACMKEQGVYTPIIDGIDASDAMLAKAKEKNIYKSLTQMYLGTGPLPD